MATTNNDDLRNRLRGEPGLEPEDTRAELLAHEARNPGAAEARREAEKEERKNAAAEAEKRNREARAKSMTGEQAKAKAVSDIAALATIAKASDAYYFRRDMADMMRWNADYKKELEASPDAHKAVLENEKALPSVNFSSLHAKQAEVTEEKYQAAADDVSAFMTTKPSDAQARAEIAARMQERGEIDPGYVNALKRITPDLSTLAEEHTPGLREEHYRFAAAARQEHERDDPFRSEGERPIQPENQRMPDSQMKAENAREAREALERGELPGRLDLNNPEDKAFKVKLEAEQREATDKGLKDQLDDELRRRKEREQTLAMQGMNSVDLQKSGKELGQDEFIMPRSIQNAYTELNGKFYDKTTNRVVFEDQGQKLATATNDKKAVEDMIALAKAKQWDSLKLSGSREFRREAWLQAESQGINTKGYTPKEADLAALETLRQSRANNMIQPLQERSSKEQAIAPRHDLNKNQAQMGVSMQSKAHEHLEAVKKIPGMEGKSFEYLNEIARLRALVNERDKLRPPAEQAETLARFDKMASDPQFQKRVQQETLAKVEDKTIERSQKRDTHEQSL